MLHPIEQQGINARNSLAKLHLELLKEQHVPSQIRWLQGDRSAKQEVLGAAIINYAGRPTWNRALILASIEALADCLEREPHGQIAKDARALAAQLAVQDL